VNIEATKMYHSGSVPQEEPKPKPPSQQTWASLDVLELVTLATSVNAPSRNQKVAVDDGSPGVTRASRFSLLRWRLLPGAGQQYHASGSDDFPINVAACGGSSCSPLSVR
jgi:hypothetical protein